MLSNTWMQLRSILLSERWKQKASSCMIPFRYIPEKAKVSGLPGDQE